MTHSVKALISIAGNSSRSDKSETRWVRASSSAERPLRAFAMLYATLQEVSQSK